MRGRHRLLAVCACFGALAFANEPEDGGCPCGHVVASGRLVMTATEREAGYFPLVTAQAADGTLVQEPGTVLVMPPQAVGAMRLRELEGQWVEIVVRRISRVR
jgi:hypothetical protein